MRKATLLYSQWAEVVCSWSLDPLHLDDRKVNFLIKADGHKHECNSSRAELTLPIKSASFKNLPPSKDKYAVIAILDIAL